MLCWGFTGSGVGRKKDPKEEPLVGGHGEGLSLGGSSGPCRWEGPAEVQAATG